jgi:hypothetical protein
LLCDHKGYFFSFFFVEIYLFIHHFSTGIEAAVASFQVRHPNILSFLHSTEVESVEGSSSRVTIYIVTEPVMPLSEKIKELGLEGAQRYDCSNLLEELLYSFAHSISDGRTPNTTPPPFYYMISNSCIAFHSFRDNLYFL